MLTIGILFCDRDLVYLENFLNTLQYKIFIPYEVILLDNRTDTSSDISFLDNFTVLNREQGNIYQLAGRKKIIENANGNFIWFVDPDDVIFEIDDSFNSLLNLDYDYYSFSYLIKSSEGEFWSELEDKTIEENLLTPDANNSLCCLWNKWIKTDVLKRVIQYIPDEARASASEDLVFVLGSLKFGTSQLQSSKYIYTFNADNSCSGKLDYSGQLEKFERCLFGLNTSNQIIKSFMTEQNLADLELNLEQNDCYFFLKKVLQTEDLQTKREMFQLIKNQFSEAVIKETWHTFLYTLEMTENQYNEMDEILSQEYGQDFGTVETTTVFIWDDGTEEVRTETEKLLPTFQKSNQQ